MNEIGRRHMLAGVMGLASAATAMAQVFQPIDVPAGYTSTYALGVSADGRTVGGSAGMSGATLPMRWTREGGIEVFPPLPGGGSVVMEGISGDGSTLVGASYGAGFTGFHACRWTTAGPEDLGAIVGPGVSLAYGVNGDGTRVVGIATFGGEGHAVLWRIGPGPSDWVDLGVLSGGVVSYARAITPDASIIIGDGATSGTIGNRLARWVGTAGPENLGGGSIGEIYGNALTPTGSVMCGGTRAQDHAWRWTAATGMRSLPVLPLQNASATCISPDGWVIGGFGNTNQGSSAAIWTPRSANAAIDLNTLLPQLGVSLAGWRLQALTGIAADGETMVGYGVHNGQNTGFIARLAPVLCQANCDGSTAAPYLNVNDFVCFMSKFGAGDEAANCDLSSTPPVLNVNDFVCFVGKFAAGCP